jgi:hypothetical protein
VSRDQARYCNTESYQKGVAAFVEERGIVLLLATPIYVPFMVCIVILQGRLRNMIKLRQVVNKPQEWTCPSRRVQLWIVLE